MRIASTISLAALSLAMALPAAHAQTAGPGPGPQTAGPNRQMIMRIRTRRGSVWVVRRGQGMRTGMRAWGRQGRGLALLRLVNNPELRQRLGITAEQAESIRQKTSAFLKTGIQNRADIQIQRLDLRDLLAADQPDRAAIDAALEKISALQLTQAKAGVNFELDMRNALTPEQRQKLMEMRGGFMRRGFGMSGMRCMRQMNAPAIVPKPPSHN